MGQWFCRVADITNLERQALVEKHLISPQLATGGQNRGLVISEDEVLSVMINEEDHLRIQCLFAGLQLEAPGSWRVPWMMRWKTGWSLLSRNKKGIDGLSDECRDRFKGLVMMHIPALVMTKQAERILSALGKVGLVVRVFTVRAPRRWECDTGLKPGDIRQVEGKSWLTYCCGETDRCAGDWRGSTDDYNRIQMADRIGRAFGILGNLHVIRRKRRSACCQMFAWGLIWASSRDCLPVCSTNCWYKRDQVSASAGWSGTRCLERDVRRAQPLQSKLRSGDNMPS